MKAQILPGVLAFGMWMTMAALPGQETSPAPRPGKEHALLLQFEGDWTARTVLAPAGQERPREVFGSEKCTLALGRFWLTCRSLSMEGQPVERSTWLGYDPQKRKYIAIRMDNVSPAATLLYGESDEAGRTLTFEAAGTDPQTGRSVEHRWVYEFEDRDRRTLKEYERPEGGKEFLSRETFCTRKALFLGAAGEPAPGPRAVDPGQ